MHAPGGAATPAERAFAWAGAGLFVASLSYFVFCYFLKFASVTPGPIEPPAVVWDVVLFSVFALHHSVFARESVKRLLARALPHLERSVYVWIASLLFLLVCALWQPVPGLAWDLGYVASLVLRPLQVFGVGLSIYSASLIDAWELAGVRQPRASDAGTNVEFRTRGPYGWVRHPIYLGWFLIVLPVGVMTMTQFVFAIVSCAYVLLAIPFEERSLLRTTGGAYRRYADQIRFKLVPGVY